MSLRVIGTRITADHFSIRRAKSNIAQHLTCASLFYAVLGALITRRMMGEHV
jgi:hypothetical protein